MNRVIEVIIAVLLAAVIGLTIWKMSLGVARAESVTVTKTVMTVDQDGNLNVAGVASVTDVATNAANVQIANAAASAAFSTAVGVTNALEGVVANIMSNNVVIYRSGYTDSFAGLVVFTDDDELTICEYEKVSLAGGILTSRIGYVCTADIGVTKPLVYEHDTLSGGLANFVQEDPNNVVGPVVHNESKTIAGTTYSKWYEITVNTPVVGSPSSYFYYIKVSGDTPGGNGATLNVPNGVTGGVTGEYAWGNKLMKFVGGLLLEVRDAN